MSGALSAVNAAFPDVPLADGVPPVLRPLGFVSGAISPLLGDAIGLGLSLAGVWGIFTSLGIPVVLADSVISQDYANDWRIADYPTQRGGFQNYNKVSTPYTARMTFAISGANLKRRLALNILDVAAGSLQLFTVVTPTQFYRNANIVRYDYQRTGKNGVELILVNVELREVRVAPSPQFASTQSPAGAATVNGGAVQAVEVAPQSDTASVLTRLRADQAGAPITSVPLPAPGATS